MGIEAVVVGESELADALGDLEVTVRRADTPEEAVGAIALERADIVILDIDTSAGVEAVKLLKRKVDDTPLLAISELGDPVAISEAMLAGASGVIARRSLAAELGPAVQVLLAGGSYLGKVDARTMVERLATKVSPSGSGVTQREREVLLALAEGLSARQIARRLDVSERTVNTHIASIYRKLRVNNRVEAVRAAMRMSLVPSDREQGERGMLTE